MSIILKGIDMPKGQSLMVFIANNGAVVCSGEDGVTTAQAIQIDRPHGRLIDWDAFNSKLDIQYAEGRGKALAPTILEEEK